MALILPNSIFYHVPKTGGTWVTQILLNLMLVQERYEPNKGSLYNLRKEHISPKDTPEDKKADKFSFAFVRNPLTWYQSHWRYRQMNNWDRRMPIDECRDNNFNRFVENVMNRFPGGFLTELYNCFYNADFLGKQEQLRTDLITALELAGEDFNSTNIYERPEINTTNTDASWLSLSQYSKDTEARVRQVECEVFEKFGY